MKTLAPVTVVTVRPTRLPAGRAEARPGDAAPPAPLATTRGPRLHLGAAERLTMLEQFATLVDSGIQIATALQTMRQQTAEPRQAAVLAALENGVVGGQPLSAAMAALPRAFPTMLTQMVRAGEATGQLGDMLRRTVEAMELDAAMRSKLRSAMLYPAIMLTLTGGVLVFLLTWIVPKFERLLRGKVLPKPTQLLLAIGDLVRDHGLWLAGGTAVLVAALALFLRTPRGGRWLDRALLHLPVIHRVYRAAVLARCTRTFGLLLQAGVPMHAALDHTHEVAGSPAYRRLWQHARSHVLNGGSLLSAVRGQPLLGPNFEQLIAAGESTATLDRVLGKVAEQHTKDLERRVRDLLTLLEPAMVVLMAGVVGFVALSIMLPIFQMSRG